MKRKISLLLIFIIYAVFVLPGLGQNTPDKETLAETGLKQLQKPPTSDSLTEIEARIKFLQEQIQSLRNLLSKIPAAAAERPAIEQAISKLESALDELSSRDGKKQIINLPPAGSGVQFANTNAVVSDSDGSRINSQANVPKVILALPGDRSTNEATDLQLGWAVDRTAIPQRGYTVEKYVVEISTERDFSSIVVISDAIKPRTVLIGGVEFENTNFYNVPKDTLRDGVKYYWRVQVFYTPTGGAPQVMPTGAFSFTTARSIFGFLSKRGFRLQRTVEGKDSTKGAQFGFLKTFGKGTVYSADFALIYNKRFPGLDGYGLQLSTEGKLSSKESESEDAWRFRGGLTIDKSIGSNDFDGIYAFLGAKFEGNQKFTTKKVAFEAMLTPTIRSLAIGLGYPGNPARPVQFRWRPFISLDLGRTLKSSTSNERKKPVFRLVPRITGQFKLNFIRQALNFSEVVLYFDETFYYLALENKKRRNFFVSGLNFNITDNFGFGFTYKNGESAPEFKRINTFDGGITVKF